MSLGSKKKEPRYVYRSEAKASHAHKMWTEVSSSVPHFLQMELLLSPILCRCLLKVLCPVSRPITTLDCVLLKDSNRAPVARVRPEINSRAWGNYDVTENQICVVMAGSLERSSIINLCGCSMLLHLNVYMQWEFFKCYVDWFCDSGFHDKGIARIKLQTLKQVIYKIVW